MTRLPAMPRAVTAFVILAFLSVFLQGCDDTPKIDAGARADEVGERVIALLKAHGAAEAAYGEAAYDADSDTVTLTGFTVEQAAGSESTLTVGRILLKEPKTPEDGSLSALSVEMFDGAGTGKDDLTMSFEKVTELEILVPAKPGSGQGTQSIPFSIAREAVVENLVIGVEPTVPVERVHVSRGELDGQIPESISVRFEGIAIRVEDIDEDETKQMLLDLGYQNLMMDVSLDWQWDSASSGSDIGPFRVTVSDAGGYELRAELGGVTRELLESSGSDDVLELAQNVTIKSLNLVYEDDSALGRARAATAKKLGVDEAQVNSLWIEEARRSLAAMETPETFNNMAIDAVTRFLDDPNRLSISINPAQPLPAGQIFGALMFSPAQLIPVLNMTVSAE